MATSAFRLATRERNHCSPVSALVRKPRRLGDASQARWHAGSPRAVRVAGQVRRRANQRAIGRGRTRAQRSGNGSSRGRRAGTSRGIVQHELPDRRDPSRRGPRPGERSTAVGGEAKPPPAAGEGTPANLSLVNVDRSERLGRSSCHSDRSPVVAKAGPTGITSWVSLLAKLGFRRHGAPDQRGSMRFGAQGAASRRPERRHRSRWI
jgi:hypothetical protein